MADAPAGDAPAAPAKSKMVVIMLCSLLAAGATGGGMYFMTAKKAAGEPASAEEGHDSKGAKTPVIYSKFDPPFVVNFQNKGMMRFLQVSIEVMTRDPATADLIKQHDPKLRNDLLMLLGGQTFETLSSREGKELLRAEALKAVAEVVAAEGGKADSVEQLFFTSFVMQ